MTPTPTGMTDPAGQAASPIARVRNRRGQGGKLGGEIVATATAILTTTGTPEAVTLRAVAREIGIATTSIYSHFPDREAILRAVADQAFTSLTTASLDAGAGLDDPVARLLAGCRAYVNYAVDHPHLYALMFTAGGPGGAPPGSGTRGDVELHAGEDPSAAGFNGLARAIAACSAAGVSASTDPFTDAVAVWMGLHGYATLRGSMTFPWPDQDLTLKHLVYSLARIPEAAQD
jgi:AcrR family transcriptional regulator